MCGIREVICDDSDDIADVHGRNHQQADGSEPVLKSQGRGHDQSVRCQYRADDRQASGNRHNDCARYGRVFEDIS